MTKTIAMAALALLVTVSPVSADSRQAATAAPKAAPIVLASIRQSPPAVRKPAEAAQQVSGLQALKWIYAVVTSHDSKTCEVHKSGVAVNFSAGY